MVWDAGQVVRDPGNIGQVAHAQPTPPPVNRIPDISENITFPRGTIQNLKVNGRYMDVCFVVKC